MKKVTLVGRRGPLQVAFTIKELREMLSLPSVSTVFGGDDFSGVDKVIPSKCEKPFRYVFRGTHLKIFFAALGRPRKRLTELLLKAASNDSAKNGDKIFQVLFKRTPLVFSGTGNSLKNLEMAVNKLEGDDLETQKAVPTQEKQTIPCSLALRSIGK